MRSCPASARAALVSLGLALAACAGVGGPAPAEVDPLLPAQPAQAALPDEVDRAAGRLAAFAMLGDPAGASAALERLRAADAAREGAGDPRTGLLDNAEELLAAAGDPRAYDRFASAALERDDLDPALRRRLETDLAQHPRVVAEQRLREDRSESLAYYVNRLVPLASRVAIGSAVNPIEAGRSAVATLLSFRQRPPTTARQRQALRAYQDYLAHYPDAPDREQVQSRIYELEERRREQLERNALSQAESALESGEPLAAQLHLARAQRLDEADPRALELERQATRQAEQEERKVRSTLEVVSQGAAARRAGRDLAVAALVGTREQLADLSRHSQPEALRSELDDERDYLGAIAELEAGHEQTFYASLEAIAERGVYRETMARHARLLLDDPLGNPYRFYQRARSSDRAQRARWLLLGGRANGARRRELWRPLEWVLDLPGFALSIVTTPVRAFQYPKARALLGGDLLRHGEDYLSRFPRGEHAQEVHRELEKRYVWREQWSRALDHHRARRDADPEQIREYRTEIAERSLRAAEQQRRRDVQASIYLSVAREYADLEVGSEARRKLDELALESTAQSIRVSREFLEQNPELWAAGALGLRPELFDGERANGELGERGVRLIGQSIVEIELRGRDPVRKRVAEPQFARFVTLLEEASYQRLALDPREQPAPDPQRDLFLERARLGLVADADNRPAASSRAEFLGTRETHGMVRRGESLLPVELVLQGGLEDFGFAAFPRIRTPKESEDSFLYR